MRGEREERGKKKSVFLPPRLETTPSVKRPRRGGCRGGGGGGEQAPIKEGGGRRRGEERRGEERGGTEQSVDKRRAEKQGKRTDDGLTHSLTHSLTRCTSANKSVLSLVCLPAFNNCLPTYLHFVFHPPFKSLPPPFFPVVVGVEGGEKKKETFCVIVRKVLYAALSLNL